jgi:O-antigen ligase
MNTLAVHPGSIAALRSRFSEYRSEQFYLDTIVVSTILAEMGEINFAGFAFRGWAWVIVLILSVVFLIPNRRRKPIGWSWLAWLPWFVWMCEKTDFNNPAAVQRLLIFTTPVLALWVTQSFREFTFDMLCRCFRLLAIGSVVLYVLAAVLSGSPSALAEWYSIAGIAMTFTLLAVEAMSAFVLNARKGLLLFGLYLLILLVTESRMPVLLLPLLFILGSRFRQPLLKPALSLAMIVGGLILFYSDPVQENLFYRGSGSLADAFSFDPEVLNVSGRLNAWPQFIDSIENIWLGDGATVSMEFGNITFDGWSHPHNEYIRIVQDYGIVGAILLSIPVVVMLVQLFRARPDPVVDPKRRWFWSTCFFGIVAMLLLGISGNVLMYVAYIGNLLFASIGCYWASEPDAISCESR